MIATTLSVFPSIRCDGYWSCLSCNDIISFQWYLLRVTAQWKYGTLTKATACPLWELTRYANSHPPHWIFSWIVSWRLYDRLGVFVLTWDYLLCAGLCEGTSLRERSGTGSLCWTWQGHIPLGCEHSDGSYHIQQHSHQWESSPLSYLLHPSFMSPHFPLFLSPPLISLSCLYPLFFSPLSLLSLSASSCLLPLPHSTHSVCCTIIRLIPLSVIT